MTVVIVGGGLAGQRCAETLRRSGYDGSIRMVCAEPHAPYDRPPLSKAVLAGTDDDLAYRAPAWYDTQGIELLLGNAATALDCDARTVTLADGETLPYGQLLIATGSRPRELQALAGRANVHTLRTLDDALALRDAIDDGGRLVIAGAGFIGQEVAVAAARAGMKVTIVETAPVPMQALLGTTVGSWFAELHRAHGVEVLLGTEIAGAHGADYVDTLTLSDGRVLACDHVVVGVGVDPDVGWLAGSRLELGRTPGVFAAGDVTGGGHWESAARQGAAAARAMLGLEPARATPSSFWSDLYDTRVQYLGHAADADAASFDGDPLSRDFTVTYMRGGAPVAVLLVGRPHELPNARALLAA
jgi:NADPH-dependent 2,4-dienoyl-CoA reductase/sulfur reductase-like enzyme